MARPAAKKPAEKKTTSRLSATKKAYRKKKIAEKFNLAKKAIAAKDWEKANFLLNEVLRLDPNDVDALCANGDAKIELEKPEDAIKDYSKALKTDSKNAYAYHRRGMVRAELKRFGRAISDLEQAIKLEPRNSDYRNVFAAIVAQKDAEETIHKWLGSLEDTTEDIKTVISSLEKSYTWIKRQRLAWIILLGAFLAYYWQSIIFPSDSIDASVQSIYEVLQHIGIVTTLSAPILMLIRITSRDAEETKVMIHDYRRMLIAENRIQTFFVSDSEQRKKSYADIIRKWHFQSPVETLLRMKKLNPENDYTENSQPLNWLYQKVKGLLLVKPEQP